MRLLFILLLSLVFSCGTKIVLPYEEHQLCRKGADSGLCGSVSDVYDYTIKNNKRR